MQIFCLYKYNFTFISFVSVLILLLYIKILREKWFSQLNHDSINSKIEFSISIIASKNDYEVFFTYIFGYPLSKTTVNLLFYIVVQSVGIKMLQIVSPF